MLCPHCICVFCIYLRTKSDLCHLQHKLIGFYNPDEKCLQRGTDWVFKYSGLRFGFRRVNIYVFCIYLRTNSDLCHLQHKLIFYNPDEKCLQRGTDWVFKYSGLRFGFRRVNIALIFPHENISLSEIYWQNWRSFISL